MKTRIIHVLVLIAVVLAILVIIALYCQLETNTALSISQ